MPGGRSCKPERRSHPLISLVISVTSYSVSIVRASRRLLLGPHLGGIIVDHRAGYGAGRELIRAGLGHGGDLGAGAADETFLESGELLGHDAALDHLEAAPLGEVDHGTPRDAVEKTIGDR